MMETQGAEIEGPGGSPAGPVDRAGLSEEPAARPEGSSWQRGGEKDLLNRRPGPGQREEGWRGDGGSEEDGAGAPPRGPAATWMLTEARWQVCGERAERGKRGGRETGSGTHFKAGCAEPGDGAFAGKMGREGMRQGF